MKQLLNWRQWVLYALFAGCFYALMMFCDETPKSNEDILKDCIEAVALMFVCGYSLCRLTKKWEHESKIQI